MARLTSESNRENSNSQILIALPDLSAHGGKLIEHRDNTSGESNKRFVLTLNYFLTTNRAVTAGEGSLSGRHTGSLSRCSILSAAPSTALRLQLPNLSYAEWIRFQDPGLSWDWPSPGNRGLSGARSQVLIYKMAIFFVHNSMLLHYQILSGGQYLIPEVLDVNERCFASGHWGLNQQV